MIIKINNNVIYVDFKVNNSWNFSNAKKCLGNERLNWSLNEADLNYLKDIIECVSQYDIPLAKSYEVILKIREKNTNAQIIPFPSFQKMVA